MSNTRADYKKIDFDKNGNPMPYDFLPLPLTDMEFNYVSCFPKSETRKHIFEGYKLYCDKFTDVVKMDYEQWIGGSFTTQKQDPADIDISAVLDIGLVKQEEEKLKPFLTGWGSKEKYYVDAYIVPTCSPGSAFFAYCAEKYTYWKNLWGMDRNNNPKAIIVRRIVYEKK